MWVLQFNRRSHIKTYLGLWILSYIYPQLTTIRITGLLIFCWLIDLFIWLETYRERSSLVLSGELSERFTTNKYVIALCPLQLCRHYSGNIWQTWGEYLKSKFGVCIGEVIIMHLLWADDLILIADTCNGLQRQLDGLHEFCSKNLTAVNEIKTKCMAFGKIETVQVNFNGKAIEQVYQYKFLGNILKYLANQAKKAVAAMYSRIRDVGTLHPHIMLHMYDCLVKPSTVYGSEVWSHHHQAQSEADKIFFWFARQVLRVKPTTSNIIVLGECGVLPPSVQCIISVLCYMNRLHNVPNDLLVNQAYCEMLRLENNGFCTWTSNVCELARSYGLDISLTTKDFKKTLNKLYDNPLLVTGSII